MDDKDASLVCANYLYSHGVAAEYRPWRGLRHLGSMAEDAAKEAEGGGFFMKLNSQLEQSLLRHVR